MPGPKPTCLCGTCQLCKQREATRRWRARNLELVRERAQAWRDATREELRAYGRRWYAEHPESVAQWAKKNPEKHNAKTRRWREQNPEKYAAQTIAGNAVRSGRLVRQPCEVCGAWPGQAHHPDHSKPLDVQWLCLRHHRELQRKSN